MFRKLLRKIGPNRFDSIVRRSPEAKSALVVWNRGMGDVALGMYALVHRFRELNPKVEITFLTRPDLREAFEMLGGVRVIVDPEMKRREPFVLPSEAENYDLVIEHPDPTKWFTWQLGNLVPKLTWKSEWDRLSDRFGVDEGSIGIHVQTETNYFHERNWSFENWKELFQRGHQERGLKFVLFGKTAHPSFDLPGVIDLRGKTELYEVLSIIKNRCRAIVTPDSGILSLVYYINASFPLTAISMWVDQKHGVIKQAVASPNPELKHIPILSPAKNVQGISVDLVLELL